MNIEIATHNENRRVWIQESCDKEQPISTESS